MNNQLFSSIDDAQTHLKDLLGEGESFDVCLKRVFVRNLEVLTVYISGLTDSETLTSLLAELQWEEKEDIHDEKAYFDAHFNYHGKEPVDSMDDFLLGVLSGRVGFITAHGHCYCGEFRQYPGRNPEEPDNEKVIRGSRDGFAENILQNAALIRRRIRSADLRFELTQISTAGKTDVSICFMKNMANTENVEWLRERFSQIHHDGLTMADKSLEEWIFKQKFHPLPFVRYSERPDIVAAHLLEGHIAIIVDTSPSVMIMPVTLFHFLQHAEEYRQAPLIGSMMRLLRYFAVFLSLILLPLWYLFAKESGLLPDALSFLGTAEKSEIPLFLQIILADMGIEYLRIAAIHTPTPLSTAMGLIAGIVIGQIAIDVGLFSSEVVLYTAIVAIFTFAIPNYELSISVKVFRVFLLMMTALFGANGFFIGLFAIFSYLCALRPMRVPYLWPLVPFFPKAFLRVFIRFPMSEDALRPYVTYAKDRDRA